MFVICLFDPVFTVLKHAEEYYHAAPVCIHCGTVTNKTKETYLGTSRDTHFQLEGLLKEEKGILIDF